ncbi:MAG: hypothetical protein DYG92_14560 [Leptolyngbya sp. PLA1]|nr:hypothetical protein [Leptolyngbya sp. PLA1]
MLRMMEGGLLIGIVICACTFAVADAILRNRRRSGVSMAELGFAPFRWYRERNLVEEARWLARLARRAFVAMLLLFVAFAIVRALGSP